MVVKTDCLFSDQLNTHAQVITDTQSANLDCKEARAKRLAIIINYCVKATGPDLPGETPAALSNMKYFNTKPKHSQSNQTNWHGILLFKIYV